MVSAMKKLLIALLVLCCAVSSVRAQTAITLPIAANAIADLGNGPIKVRMVAGNASIFTSQSSGIGSTSGSSTALTLTTTPATAPIVGGLISGVGIASGTTIVAYNGTTGITLSAAMTVPSSTTVSWGAACPSSVGSAPVIQASPQADYFIMYTQARVCAVSPGGPVNTLLIDPVFYSSTVPGGGAAAGVPGNFPVYNSAGTGLIDSGVYLSPPGGLQLYASPSGSDTNNTCLASGTPCTLLGACASRARNATYLAGAAAINLAHGTYPTTDVNNALCAVLGNSGGSAQILTTIQGDCGSPTAVILAVPNNKIGILATDAGEVVAKCLEITGGNNSVGLQATQFAILDVDTVTWGTWGANGVHLTLAHNAAANLAAGGETVTSNVLLHWQFASGATFVASGVSAITNGTAFTGAFMTVTGNASVDLSSWSFTGSGITGQRAILTGPGYLITNSNAPCNSSLPGSAICLISRGFLDSAGDPSSVPGPLAASQFGNLPTPVAGLFVHLTDGKASNCGDASCTTWGTTVTNGGGGLDLIIWYNGTNWTLVGK